MINRQSPVPPWQQLAALIRARIESGELAPGARLPSLVDLSHEYDLSVSTLQKTVAALKAEGLIVTSPMGMFVRE